jgi:hypothetical protein
MIDPLSAWLVIAGTCAQHVRIQVGFYFFSQWFVLYMIRTQGLKFALSQYPRDTRQVLNVDTGYQKLSFRVWINSQPANDKLACENSEKAVWLIGRVLARILDLGHVTNNQGMQCQLHGKITVLVMLANNNYMLLVVLCFATKYKASIRSYCALTLKY